MEVKHFDRMDSLTAYILNNFLPSYPKYKTKIFPITASRGQLQVPIISEIIHRFFACALTFSNRGKQ